MFFNNRIKWTIDVGQSEVMFKVRCIELTGVSNMFRNIDSESNMRGNYFDESISGGCGLSEIPISQTVNNQMEMFVKAEEYFSPLSYSLVVLDEKKCRRFWQVE